MISRISRRAGFARFSGSRATRHQGLSVRVVRDEAANGVHVAFSTPKRIGTAVVRNRVRRQLREVMRTHAPHLPSGWYLIGVDHLPVDNGWGQLNATLQTLLPSSRGEGSDPRPATTTSSKQAM
ncbi:MAG: ribonuclease P protein component [Ilumatobacteraceae bacterium]